jgi:phospholipid-binding lipoprotein MlaA
MKMISLISVFSMLCLIVISVPCLAEDLTFTPLEIMPSCSAAGFHFRTIPAGFNAPLGFESQRLEFLTGFTPPEISVSVGEEEGPIQVALANIPPTSSKVEEPIETIADPLEPINRAFFKFNDKFYFWILKPVASGYKAIIPEDGRVGVRNFFSNLTTPIRLVNCLLQAKFKGAGNEVVRFLVNTPFGLAGFLDTAKKEFKIGKQEADFGQTLGIWGIGPAFFINWPILGPSSLRDTVGFTGDLFLDPENYLITSIPINLAVKSYNQVNETSLTLGEYEDLKEAALDPYIALKDAYHQYRQNKIKER